MVERLDAMLEAVAGLLHNRSLLGGTLGTVVFLVTIRSLHRMYHALVPRVSYSLTLSRQDDGSVLISVKVTGSHLSASASIYWRSKSR